MWVKITTPWSSDTAKRRPGRPLRRWRDELGRKIVNGLLWLEAKYLEVMGRDSLVIFFTSVLCPTVGQSPPFFPSTHLYFLAVSFKIILINIYLHSLISWLHRMFAGKRGRRVNGAIWNEGLKSDSSGEINKMQPPHDLLVL